MAWDLLYAQLHRHSIPRPLITQSRGTGGKWQTKKTWTRNFKLNVGPTATGILQIDSDWNYLMKSAHLYMIVMKYSHNIWWAKRLAVNAFACWSKRLQWSVKVSGVTAVGTDCLVTGVKILKRGPSFIFLLCLHRSLVRFSSIAFDSHAVFTIAELSCESQLSCDRCGVHIRQRLWQKFSLPGRWSSLSRWTLWLLWQTLWLLWQTLWLMWQTLWPGHLSSRTFDPRTVHNFFSFLVSFRWRLIRVICLLTRVS